jgi:hypothetical protein
VCEWISLYNSSSIIHHFLRATENKGPRFGLAPRFERVFISSEPLNKICFIFHAFFVQLLCLFCTLSCLCLFCTSLSFFGLTYYLCSCPVCAALTPALTASAGLVLGGGRSRGERPSLLPVRFRLFLFLVFGINSYNDIHLDLYLDAYRYIS